MNVGRYIFRQVVDYVPRYQIDKLVAKYHGDWHVKDLTCYNQFLHLLFGQLSGCDSLRDICMCLHAHSDSLYHLGFRNTVEHSSLSCANERRDYSIYEDLGNYLISLVRPLYSRASIEETPWTMSFMLLTPPPYPPASSWLHGLWENTAKVP